MGYSNPSVDDFKSYFARAFTFSADPTLGVTDDDITRAFQLTNTQINIEFFPDQSTYTIGYLNLSAHFLVTSLNAFSGGIVGGRIGIESSKSVGSVSQSFHIPEYYYKNPMWARFTSTPYGLWYLEMIYPYTIGRMTYVRGSTRP